MKAPTLPTRWQVQRWPLPVSNATVAWSTLGIHKQPAKSATFKPTEKPTCKTSRQIFLSLGRTESNTTRGNVSDGSATGER